MKGSRGFTLAEVLIALALLGIVAAFSVPKVLNAVQDNQNRVVLTETISSIEESWYRLKLSNQLDCGSLYNCLVNGNELNTLFANPGWLCSADYPLYPVQSTHACCDSALALNGGFVSHTGAVVMGLLNAAWTPAALVNPPTPTGWRTQLLCIDTNGVGQPNRLGQDVFVGNFNLWGDFDVDTGTRYASTKTGKNFHWGSRSEPIYDSLGNPRSAPFDVPEARAGIKLAE